MTLSIMNWGSTEEEKRLHLPGEEAIGNPDIATTQAITINATPKEIWPWLIQMGSDRGGFYSYSWLENLVGCKVTNTKKIIPELQNLKVGDTVSLHPKAPPLRVNICDNESTLALEGWVFHLVPMGPKKTRLLSRTYEYKSPKVGRATNAILNSSVFEFAHFVMGRKQLIEIKRLAEQRTGAISHSDLYPGERKLKMAGRG
jgi:hypothetical protein